jgi:hypothetical protein
MSPRTDLHGTDISVNKSYPQIDIRCRNYQILKWVLKASTQSMRQPSRLLLLQALMGYACAAFSNLFATLRISNSGHLSCIP